MIHRKHWKMIPYGSVKIRCPYANMQPNPKVARRMAKEDILDQILEGDIQKSKVHGLYPDSNSKIIRVW